MSRPELNEKCVWTNSPKTLDIRTVQVVRMKLRRLNVYFSISGSNQKFKNPTHTPHNTS